MNEKKKILVVDDNKDFCENVKDELEMKNYDVMVAYNGLKGIDMAKRHGVDLIFMDIRMPGMWGVDALKKIKKMAPSTPVIMVTAYGVEDIIRESLHEGAYGALNKPLDFDNEKLTSIIERAMSEKLRVLVVDDDEDFCVSINDILSDGGCSVAIAHDSVAAIQKALENDFDVMLVDMKPPTWNGLGTCRIIKDYRPNISAIVVTDYMKEMSNQVKDALEKGAFTCFEKPLVMEKLLSLLEQIRGQKAGSAPKKPG